ncbi:hypothetical protein, partial [Finegoldia magna]|uniref:hypothetical protein n=1 Tax=Finegoldia magna TaxID=1260 RepID=UPI001B86C3D0
SKFDRLSAEHELQILGDQDLEITNFCRPDIRAKPLLRDITYAFQCTSRIFTPSDAKNNSLSVNSFRIKGFD